MAIGGLCLIAAAGLAIALIVDWAWRDPPKQRPVVLADRSSWRRPRRAFIKRVAIQCGYFVMTLAGVDLALRWGGAF